MIELTQILYLWLFIVFMVGTPGPANLLIMSIGSIHGVKACFPFNLGLIGGKFILNIGMGLGLFVILNQFYNLQIALKFLSAFFMIYLSIKNWKIDKFTKINKAHGFREGLIIHPINPKAWVMIIIAWTEFGPFLGNFLSKFLIISLSFAFFQLILHTSWCYFGYILSKSFPNSSVLNRSLIILTIAVVIWAVFL